MIILFAFAFAAFLVIFCISLNEINPWAGKPVPGWMKTAAFTILVLFLLNLAFGSFFGGVR